jgi:CBS domain-containing protein
MLATDVVRTWFATVRPNAPLLDAIRFFLETDQRGLPVIDDNGSLVGVISKAISFTGGSWK